jgi:hypothetical protein
MQRRGTEVSHEEQCVAPSTYVQPSCGRLGKALVDPEHVIDREEAEHSGQESEPPAMIASRDRADDRRQPRYGDSGHAQPVEEVAFPHTLRLR